MPELRLNLITNEWVIVSTERAKSPAAFRKKKTGRSLPRYVRSCPFCPGNEERTPEEIYRVAEDSGWKIRVVPNKFPALGREVRKFREESETRNRVSGFGIHDVIIETPAHDVPMAYLPLHHVADIVRVYKRRFLEINEDKDIGQVVIFKNHGEASGTSLEHSHSQIVGTPVTSFQIKGRLSESRSFFDRTGSCLLCRTVEDEKNEGKRIVHETEHFLTFIPYAALSAFHTWIFPKRHMAVFSAVTEKEIIEFARHLKIILSKLYVGLNNPDFNFTIRSIVPGNENSEYCHWYLSIVPRLSIPAGFELGSGMYLNAAVPEDVAEYLRGVSGQG